MKNFSLTEMRLTISNSTKNNLTLPYLKSLEQNQKIISHRVNLIKTLKIYIKKYCFNEPHKNNILYLSILYLDIILSKNRINLQYDKNLKYLCLCCFILSIKFIGNYDISKRIIKNFCNNYKEEYKIFEIQCLILLEHNLLYSTAYDYINMILSKESKNLQLISSSFLYQLCEDKLFIRFSPFYISVAIIQLAKNTLKNKSYNHYDKYFNDQRVRYIYKMFSYVLNPFHKRPSFHIGTRIDVDNTKNNYIENNENINNNTLNYNNFSYNTYNNSINYRIYGHERYNKSSSINIFANNNIQNNIVIINDFSRKKNNTNNKKFNTNNNSLNNNTNIANEYNNEEINIRRKTLLNNKNRTPSKIYVNIRSGYNISNYDSYNKTNCNSNMNNNYVREFYFNDEDDKNNYHVNNIGSKNKSLIKSYFNNDIIKDYYKRNTHKILKLQNKKLLPNCRINYCSNSTNKLPFFSSKRKDNNSLKKLNRYLINENNPKKGNLSNDIIPNHNKSNTTLKRKVIYTNKSTLNFQLVSGVSKEKLEKLSRNLSKTLVKTSDKSSQFPKLNNN